jgi:hypothetical protein
VLKYVVIEYKGSHSFSNRDIRKLVSYEFSDNIDYIRKKYNLPPIKNEFSFTIEGNGFSQYHIKSNIGRLLFDIDTFKSVYKNNVFKLNVEPILNSAIRDFKIKSLIEKPL